MTGIVIDQLKGSETIRHLTCLFFVLILISTQASGMAVSAVSSNGAASTDMSTSYESPMNGFVEHDLLLSPADGLISNHQYGTGGTEKKVTMKDASGNTAQSHFKIVSGTGTQYWSEFRPASSGTGTAQTEMWLVAKNAKSIDAYSKASNKAGTNYAQSSASIASTTLSASLDYYTKASAGSSSYYTLQLASSGKGNNAPANAVTPTGSPSVPTLANGAYGSSITFMEASSYGTRSSNVGLKEAKSASTGDYVALTGYEGIASASATSVSASHTVTSGSANSINIYGTAKDSSGTYNVNTQINGISGGKATFQGLIETASAGTTTQVTQKEHVHGSFSSTAKGTRTIPATSRTITRKSDYGTEYDLTLAAKKTTSGPSVSGIVGYYVNPTLKIQGAVNAAQSGDAINVASGTYKENVQIDKSLTVNGAGLTKTIVDGNKKGSVFYIGKSNQKADVTLSGMTIQGGSGTKLSIFGGGEPKLCGGGILNNGQLTVNGCYISHNTADYGGGICNTYSNKATIKGSSILENKASTNGGGIYSDGTVILTGSTVSKNAAAYGGGIVNDATISVLSIASSTISENTASSIGGICNYGTMDITGSTISGNSGGGISQLWGKAKVMDSTISGNSADFGGGIYVCGGSLFVGGKTQITNNLARLGYGGGVYFSSSSGSVTFSGTEAAIKNNKAYSPSSELSWYQGWGVYLYSGTPTTAGGFKPSNQVTGNTHT